MSPSQNPSSSQTAINGYHCAPPITRYAACSADVLRRRGRRAGRRRRRPTRLSSTWLRSSGVARSSRGNHASGTPSVRRSVSSTQIVCSSKRTLTGEIVMRRIVARMERSAIRDRDVNEQAPDFASLHPGYACCYKRFGSFGLTKPPTTPVGVMRPVTPHSGQGCRQNLAARSS